ncbi:MAG: hypothetical protein PVH61_31795 [Candidatus Aminicenantes bacterium]
METKKREKYYWSVCLLFMFLSPILIYHGLNYKMVFDFDPVYYGISMVVGLIAVFPFETIPVLLRGEKYDLKIGAKYPEYKFETTSRMEFGQSVEEITRRLKEIGFSVKEMKKSDSMTVVQFHKDKTTMAQSIMDNAIRGSVRVEKKFSKPDIKAEVIYGDILLMDSGESEAMNALARYISLDQAYFHYQNINLTLTAGTMTSFITNVLLYLHYTGVQRFEPSIFVSASIGAIGLIVIGLFFIYRDKKYLIGTRIGIAGLYLALLTFIPVVNALLASPQDLF